MFSGFTTGRSTVPEASASVSSRQGSRGVELQQGEYTVGGCVVRFEPRTGRPKVHSNRAHYCAGVRKVSVDRRTGLLEIELMQSRPIVSFYVEPDETLTERGVTAGGSGGVNRILVRFYDTKTDRPLNLNLATDRRRIAGPTSNIWVGWTHLSK